MTEQFIILRICDGLDFEKSSRTLNSLSLSIGVITGHINILNFVKLGTKRQVEISVTPEFCINR
jgi:hypothetical protein